MTSNGNRCFVQVAASPITTTRKRSANPCISDHNSTFSNVRDFPILRRRSGRTASSARIEVSAINLNRRGSHGPACCGRHRPRKDVFVHPASHVSFCFHKSRYELPPNSHSASSIAAVRSRSTSLRVARNSTSPSHSHCTPHGGQRYCCAKRQELGAALVAFIAIGKCNDRARAVMSDEAKDVRANCRYR